MGRHKARKTTRYPKQEKWDYTQMRCPYCGHKLIFRTAEQMGIETEEGVNFWACSNYPECDAYVRTLKNSQKPRGTVANAELRGLRQRTHSIFNKLYTSGYMRKEEAYLWLKNILGCTGQQAHIGQFSEYNCNLVIKEASKFMKNNPQHFKNKAS